MEPDKYVIQTYIDWLDEEVRRVEAVWGPLPLLASLVPPDLAVKWHAQIAKLNAAIREADAAKVYDLVSGTVRGLAAMDAAASAAGHKMRGVGVWDAVHPETGRRYRICVNNNDAVLAAEKDVCVYTLAEVVRLLEAAQLVNCCPSVAQMGAVRDRPDGSAPFREDVPW